MSFLDNLPLTVASVLNEVTSIPQVLYQTDQNISAMVAGSLSGANGNFISGMSVFNNTNPGTIAYAAVPPSGKVDGQIAQRLICSINSDHEPPSSRIIDFTTKPDVLDENRDNQLFMHVYPYDHKALTNQSRGPILAENGNTNLIPLLVSPGSVCLAPPLTNDELEKLGYSEASSYGFDFSSILKGVVKSVPIVADAGMKIYQELSSNGATSTSKTTESTAILGIIGAVANIAVPLVGSLIKKALD